MTIRIAVATAVTCAMALLGLGPASAAEPTGYAIDLITSTGYGAMGELVVDGPTPSRQTLSVPRSGSRITADAVPGEYTATFVPRYYFDAGDSVTFTVRDGATTSVTLETTLQVAASGTLVDERGAPLAGVTVHATAGAYTRARADTASDGTFELTYLEPGTYRLDFTDTYAPTSTVVEVLAGETTALGEVVARRGASVATRVVDEIGAPAPDVGASLRGADGTWVREARSGSDGRVRFTGVPAGRAVLEIEHDRAEPASRTVEVTATTARVADFVVPLVVQLHGGLSLPGRLRGDEKLPTVRAALFAESGGRPVGSAIDATTVSWHQGLDGWSWATFELAAPASQRYVVRYSEVTPTGTRVLQHQAITVGREDVSLDDVTPSFGAPITGEVRDSGLGLWPGIGVVYKDVPCDGSLPTHRGGPMVMSDARGKFRVPTLPGHCYALTVGNTHVSTTYVTGLERVRPGRTGVVVHPRLANHISRVTSPDARTIRVTVTMWPTPDGVWQRVVDGGTVKVREHGRVIGTATVDRQAAVVHLTRPLAAGKHTWRIDYGGTRLFQPSTTLTTIVRR